MIWNSKFHTLGVEIGDPRDNYSEIALVKPKNAPKLKIDNWRQKQVFWDYICAFAYLFLLNYKSKI